MKLNLKRKPQPAALTLPLAVDSGAHSFLTQHFATKNSEGKIVKGTTNADYSHVKSPEFRKYLEDYMAWVHKHGKHLEFYVMLDIIFNPELTWEIYQEMKRNGLQPIPVYHYGEDPKWLKKYIEDTDYIGMGGIGHITKQQYLPFGTASWKIICDSKGMPRVKVHGFAMSSFDLLAKWPWYSVDSTSAFSLSRYGALMMPHVHKHTGDFNFGVTPSIMPISDRRAHYPNHIAHRHTSGLYRKAIDQYLELVNVTYDDARTEYLARDIANLYFMNQMMATVAGWHSERIGQKINMLYYASGSPTGTLPGFLATVEHLKELNSLDHLCYLGTFYRGMRRPTNFLLETWHGVQP